MQQEIQFSGFTEETFKFMAGLKKHNNTKWFNGHREMYEQHLVKPARDLVTSIGDFVHFLSPAFDTEPKFNRAIVRISRDMRFAKGNPYKDYFLIRFGRFKWDSELFVVISEEGAESGAFINNDKRDDTSHFRSNVTAYPDRFIETCNRYGIGRKYAVYELTKDTSLVVQHFNPDRDWRRILDIPLFLIGRDYSPKNRLIKSPGFIIELMNIYSRLYPLLIFSTSVNVLKDLESYEERVGVVEVSERRAIPPKVPQIS
jgi:uncharacterized protein (DUF2461 family)